MLDGVLNKINNFNMKRRNPITSFAVALIVISSFFLVVAGPAYAVTTTITFDNPVPSGISGDLLNGVFQGIDFGTGQWRWESAYSVDPTNHIFFDSAVGTARTFQFSPAPKVLQSIRVFTGINGTLTLTSDAGETATQAITSGSMQTVTTNWTRGATVITVSFSAGWSLGVDDITFSDPAPVNPPILAITAPAQGAVVPGTIVNVSYTRSGDMTGITNVHFRLDGGPTLTDTALLGSYQLSNIPVGSHALTGVLARADQSEVMGTATTTAFSTIIDPADPTPPTVSITSPINGSTTTGTISIGASATDNKGVASVQFRVDGAPLGLDSTTSPYTALWDTSASANGSHILTARARDLAGNETISAPVSVTVSNISSTSPSLIGQWSAPFTMPIVAVNTVLLPSGKVLMWDGDTQGGDARVWDPATGVFTAVPNTASNMFCSGNTLLADGSTMVIGGHTNFFIGIRDVNRFNPTTQSWSQLAPMSFQRWYPTATTLGDGRVLAVSGTTVCASCNADVPEIYNAAANTWTQLTGAQYAMPLYPFMFQLPDGRVLYAGSDEADTITRTLDVNTQVWTTVDPVVRTGGSAAMYRPGKVIKAGSPGNVDAPPAPATNVAYAIDMTQPSPVWRQVGSMSQPRSFQTLIVLPDGNVAVTGGVKTTDETSADGAFSAEIWNAQTESWSTMASGQVVRSYHSTALLLPDGRVLVAGSGRLAGMTNEFRGEIFSPPYLFKGARPAISAASSTMQYGTQSWVSTPDAASIASAALVRLGADTHGYDENQRYVPLSLVQSGGGLNIQLPANGNIAPPGHYMLFLVNASGVPSVASIIRLDAAPDTQPPTVAITSPLSGTTATGTIAISATASDNVGVAGVQFLLDGANLGAEVTASPYITVWNTATASNGSHTLTARARDAAGNASTSAPVTVTVANTASTSSGLVAAYSFNEGSGATTADRSGNGQTGTLSGSAWTASGRYGSALSFNGTNSWVTVNGSNLLDLTTAMTLEAWIYPTTAMSGWRTTVTKEGVSPVSAYYLYANSDTNQPANGVTIAGTEYALKTGSTPALNAWTHLAATYDGAMQRLYINGTLVGSQPRTGSIQTTANPLRIGGNSLWGEYFTGSIDGRSEDLQPRARPAGDSNRHEYSDSIDIQI